MMPTYLEPEHPKRPIRTAIGVVVAVYVLVFLVAHAIYWFGGSNDAAAYEIPTVQTDPAFPDPNVLHKAPVRLPEFAVEVPYQAGVYEIEHVLPAELFIGYREQNGSREAQVVVFNRPMSERWAFLAPFPAKMLLSDGLNAKVLLNSMQLSPQPSALDHLFPWRLVRWQSRRQLRDLVLAEGERGRLVRIWVVNEQGKTVVGRDYETLEEAGNLVSMTLFGPRRQVDVRFAFNTADRQNMALVKAFIQAVDLGGKLTPDNQNNLLACQRLGLSEQDEAAMRICRELYLVGLWNQRREDLSIAKQLFQLYRRHRSQKGMKVLQQQLSFFRSENAQMRRLLQEMEQAQDEMMREQLTPAAEETQEPEEGEQT